MKVKITEDMFTTSIYEIKIKENSLFLYSDKEKDIIIPFDEIKHFNVEGKGKCLKRFLLETKDGDIEGFFQSDEDAENSLSLLRANNAFYVDVNLNPVN